MKAVCFSPGCSAEPQFSSLSQKLGLYCSLHLHKHTTWAFKELLFDCCLPGNICCAGTDVRGLAATDNRIGAAKNSQHLINTAHLLKMGLVHFP